MGDALAMLAPLSKALEGRQLTAKEMDSVLSNMLEHWPYHQRNLARLRKKWLEAPEKQPKRERARPTKKRAQR